MSKRVLIVDDEPDIREVASMSLEMLGGYEVVTAGCGEEALALAASEHPDAILLDVMLPGMDGPSTFRRLQQDEATREIPVLLLTAKAQAGDRRLFDELGVVATLTKPFDPKQLPVQVADALGWD